MFWSTASSAPRRPARPSRAADWRQALGEMMRAKSNDPRLDRRDAMRVLLEDRGDMLVVTGLGSTTWGAAARGGLGLAVAQPGRRVRVVTGDGEILMGLGALATIGVQRPPNLAIAVFDNGHYAETGMQRSEEHTSEL